MNGEKHEYVVDGTKIISDCWFESTVRHYIAYIYDAKGVIGMAYRNNGMDEDKFEYFIFKKNLQGDIIAVYDEYGFAAVTYTYDAWGNVTETLYDTTSNGQYNSFRYRGIRSGSSGNGKPSYQQVRGRLSRKALLRRMPGCG